MDSRMGKSLNRRFVLRCCALTLCALATTPAWPDCPKLLFDGGVFIRQQTNAQQAAYWGQTVGVQGFMVHEVMRDWDTDVGTDPDSSLWRLVHQFQTTYSQYGVTDNFIRVGLFSLHDWHNSRQNEVAAKNFAHAAALAKYAGFKGMALDMEPYQPTWGGGQALAGTVQQEGRAIAQAMHEAYPGMTLVIENDALHNAFELHQPITAIANVQGMPPDSSKIYHGGYQLAVPFLRGLLSVDWSHVVIATEETYKDYDIVNVVQQTAKNYTAFLGDDTVWANLSVAPGLWPLGLSKDDKSPRQSPKEFEQQLKAALGSSQYVWIYGFGSAWQADGPYGAGPVAANFQQYLDVVHRERATCSASGQVSSTDPPGHHWRASTDPAQPLEELPHIVPLRAAGSSQNAGTLPRIELLRPAGSESRQNEIP